MSRLHFAPGRARVRGIESPARTIGPDFPLARRFTRAVGDPLLTRPPMDPTRAPCLPAACPRPPAP